MKRYGVIIAGLLLFCSCFSRSSMMTQETFSSIQVGTSIQVVVQENGEPYAVDQKNGLQEYKYVERITNGNQLIYENHFVLLVQDGVVVGKTSTREQVPAFGLIYQDDPNHNQYP
jgi:hypothetical protein